MPHAANFNPELALIMYLGGRLKNKWPLVILFMLIVTDIIFSLFYKLPAFGSFTLFTYSGFLFPVYFARIFLRKWPAYFIFLVLLANMFYWGWTNAGTWLFSGLYPHTKTGFFYCYSMALPFLKNELLANALVSLLISLQYILRYPRTYLSGSLSLRERP